MRRRRVGLVLGVVAAAIAVVIALSNQTNEFAFLRKYPHTESMMPPDFVWEQLGPSWHSPTRQRIYRFPDLSKELYSEIKSYAKTPTSLEKFEIELPNGRMGTFIHRLENSRLVFYDEPSPSWFALRWASVRRHLGWVDPEEKRAKERFESGPIVLGQRVGKP